MTTVNDIIESLPFKLHVREQVLTYKEQKRFADEVNKKSFYSAQYKCWFPRWFQEVHGKSFKKTTQEKK